MFKDRIAAGTFWIWLSGIFLIGCNPAKYVPSDKYLLSKTKVMVDTKRISSGELKNFVRQKENKKILGLRLYLGFYNLSDTQKHNGINRYLRSIGEEPAIWDPTITSTSRNQMQEYLVYKGYINAQVRDSIIRKGKRKVKVIYYVHPSIPYTIRSLKYTFDDTSIQRFVYSDTININNRLKIRRQGLFDQDLILNERGNLEYLMRNNGYYRFTRDLVSIYGDTALNSHQVDLVMNIANEEIKLDNGQTISLPQHQYKINQVTIRTENDRFHQTEEQQNARKDTILKYGVRFIYQNNFWVKPSIIQQSNYILPGALFKISDVEETKSHLSSLGVFTIVNTSQFTEITSPDTSKYKYLDCQIRLTPQSIQSYDWGIVGTNSSGNFGGALDLIYQHRSLFGNAENFNLRFRGALEAVSQNESNRISRAMEYGVDATLKFPQFLLPFNSMGFKKKYNPKTYITLSYNYQKRPEYTMTAANATFGYSWKGVKGQTHTITPLEFTYVNLPYESGSFQSDKRTNYLWNSYYTPHLVTVTGYSYTYDDQDLSKKVSDYHYFQFNLESSGNIMTWINQLRNRTKDSVSISNNGKKEPFYTLFGLPYSQYLKADVDFHYFHVTGPNRGIVYRLFGGVGYPYGNARSLPFEKQYISTVRGWNLRKLGPGSAAEDTLVNYPNSTGDIKLEANIEFRSKIFWIFEGALFMDVGNVWTTIDDPLRPGGKFKFDKFYRDIAVATGVGLRLNFNYFLVRLDVGLKTRDPRIQKWVFDNGRIIIKNDCALSFGIGYPF